MSDNQKNAMTKMLCSNCRLELNRVRENAEMIEYNSSGSHTWVVGEYECPKCHAKIVIMANSTDESGNAVRDA